jgi:hypothetical protein
MKIEDTNRDAQAGNLRLPELNWAIGTNTHRLVLPPIGSASSYMPTAPGSHRRNLNAFTAHGVLRLNCLAASTTVPTMKKSIILVSALSVVVMALVSCASHSDVDPFQVHAEKTAPYQEPAPSHTHSEAWGH